MTRGNPTAVPNVVRRCPKKIISQLLPERVEWETIVMQSGNFDH